MSKTNVLPIKRLSIPCLELRGACLLARLPQHVKDTLQVPLSNVSAWTNTITVLHWLTGSPRRFKTYVGNRVSSKIDQIPYDRWNHVVGTKNPVNCTSRGTFPVGTFGVRGLVEESFVIFDNRIIDANAPSYVRTNLSWEAIANKAAQAKKRKYKACH